MLVLVREVKSGAMKKGKRRVRNRYAKKQEAGIFAVGVVEAMVY